MSLFPKDHYMISKKTKNIYIFIVDIQISILFIEFPPLYFSNQLIKFIKFIYPILSYHPTHPIILTPEATLTLPITLSFLHPIFFLNEIIYTPNILKYSVT